ncbi:MAG: DUF3098 domain-containing protein [Prevotella sp.]|nr:DUF3098 domain-containing protein [Prevotella sp.]
MDKRNYAFGRINFIWLLGSVLLIVIGFILMGGKGTTEEAFNPDIFSATRIKIAPALCFIGFVSTIFAIMKKPKTDKGEISE